ncbi:MAG: aconitase X catalytic domain-containing protein [Anaerolineae bacterium]|nr:aconitase X catalytic domain-containing protein [Anaerolineae bacterium]
MADELYLSAEERSMFDGEQGIAVRRAIEIVIALGKIYGAKRLVPVGSVQVAGVSYKNLGEAGLDFLREWAAQGARVCVPTMLNPAGIDMQQWERLGFSADFARQQEAVIDAYTAMGIAPTCTCTPYLTGSRPGLGEHIAWAESSAVSFANSVLGARTNREGGPSALAAAICGRTAAYGLHLDPNRVARYRVEVRCKLGSISDWSALGYLVGRQVRDGVPYFLLGDVAVPPTVDQLKSLGAAMAASGAVALYHIDGITLEAQGGKTLAVNAQQIIIDDLAAGYAALNSGVEQVDLVSIGCPHASVEELAQVARLVEGKQLRSALWVTTARATGEHAAQAVEIIQAAGGRVVADTCMVVAPVEQLGFKVMATNSAKMAAYTPAHSRLQVRFGTLEQCIEAALTGRWR